MGSPLIYMGTELTTVMETSLDAVMTDVTSIVMTALPVCMGIMALFLAIRLGIGFFRSIAN